MSIYTSAVPNHSETPEGSMKSNNLPAHDLAAQIDSVVNGYDQIVRRLTATRSAGIFESSVTMAQLKVLMLLGAQPETRMSEVASALHLTLSTVSGVVERLVESDLASRRTDDVDRRQVMVSLTSEGA